MKNVKYYANMINLSGLYSKNPVEVEEIEELDGFWSFDREFCAREIGIDKKDESITICSINKADVIFWTEGIKNCMELLQNWVRNEN
jgi:hypothetical protein